MKMLSRFALGAVALAILAGLALPVQAGEPPHADCSMPAYLLSNGGGYKFDQMAGGTIGLTSAITQGTVNFGFEADVVMIEVQAPNNGNGAWFRRGTTLTDSAATSLADVSGMTVVATSPANFITGAGATKGSAISIVTAPVSPTGAATVELRALSTKCVWLPLKTRGMIAVHGSGTLGALGTSENVTVHVQGFNQVGTE